MKKHEPVVTKTTTVTEEVEILFPEQLARRLGLKHIGTLANWRCRGLGPKFLRGKPIRYLVKEVEKWEQKQMASSTAEYR